MSWGEKMKIIAKIKTPYSEKFGVPRQSNMTSVLSKIIFEPEYRDCNSIRGLSDFSHIWVLWKFSGFESDQWSPTVRPPRLGGNKRMGVFATRSPNRPNPIGMSSLRLIHVDTESENAPILTVCGADMIDGTEIYDIKPYLPFSDSHPNAIAGFTEAYRDYRLNVIIPQEIVAEIDEDTENNLREILSLDPRPSYQNDNTRIYGMTFSKYNVKFKVDENNLTVISIKQD
jgi:tRNA-Thr(GGU) m(6)t(6)A37 methyltransferase TsaA